MFSYPSSPLFEQPFNNRDAFAEQTPLRSRSNNGGGGGYGENDAFISSGNTFTVNTNSAKRKRPMYQHAPDRWIKTLMRFVLLSPLIVLVLWSIGAVLFTHKRQSNSYPKSQRSVIVQPRNLQAQLKTGVLEGIEMVSEALGEPQPANLNVQMMAAPMGSSMQQVQQPMQGASQGQKQVQQPMQGTSQIQQPMQGSSGQLLVAGASHQNSLLQVPPPPAADAQNSNSQAQPAMQSVEQVQQPLQGASLSQQDPKRGFIQAMMPRKNSKPKNMVEKVENLLSPHKKAAQPAAPQLRGSGSKQVLYLYYDPMQTSMGPEGQVLLPPVLYDSAGNSIEAGSISQSSQVYMQPPPVYGSTGVSSLESPPSMGEAISVQSPSKGFAVNSESFNKVVKRVEEQDGGSSVIVATVAVMALLVGAISARKLRGAGALANCIENERLDHVAAYDTATESNTAYSTFHWKGDLEKFDV